MIPCRCIYKVKKHLALQIGPRFRRYVWHIIMLKCVLVTVRQWLPNPEGKPYIRGHMEIMMYASNTIKQA